MNELSLFSLIPIILLFTPSVILALMPNRWSWLILTITILSFLFGDLAWHVIQDSFMKNSQNLQPIINLALCIIPALLAKIFCIITKNRKRLNYQRIFPLLGFLGPIIVIFSAYIWKYLIYQSLLQFLNNYRPVPRFILCGTPYRILTLIAHCCPDSPSLVHQYQTQLNEPTKHMSCARAVRS